MLLPGMDHFAQDLIAGLPAAIGTDVRGFPLTGPEALPAALAWADRPDIDAIWFEFCWPPFPALIARTDFAGRRVIVRVHRIEAMETDHVARTDWTKVSDLIVVSTDMAARVSAAVPDLHRTTRLRVIHNGLDLGRFAPLTAWDPFRIGWCGLMTLRKNPVLALQIMFALRVADERYHLHLCSSGGEPLATESFLHLLRRLDLGGAVHLDGRVAAADMPAWHARNGVLLHTSLHESFGYAIAEAAATGCDIAVLDHPGSAEFWPAATRYATPEEAVWLIRDAAPHRWRHHVAQHFALERQLAATADLLRAPALAKAS